MVSEPRTSRQCCYSTNYNGYHSTKEQIFPRASLFIINRIQNTYLMNSLKKNCEIHKLTVILTIIPVILTIISFALSINA